MLTQDEVIARIVAVHGSRYDLSSVKFRNVTDKLTIHCPACGNSWDTLPRVLWRGCGCPTCYGSAKMTKVSFTSKSVKVHGDKYDYTLSQPNGNSNKVKIRCKVHDSIFEQSPASHLKGSGCPACGRERSNMAQWGTTAKFVVKASKIHNGLYEYAKVNYRSSLSAICITCTKCRNDFHQTPEGHLSGSGCPNCVKSGFSLAKHASLYILESVDGTTKIGITNRTAVERLREINKSSGKKFKVVTEIRFISGEVPMKVETQLLKELRQQYSSTLQVYDGSTESFLSVDYDRLLRRVVELSAEFLK